MTGSYQVEPTELANGSKSIQSLSDQAESISTALTGTFADLMGAVGNESVANALGNANGVCTARMREVLALLGYVSETLGDNARTYQTVEEQNSAAINSVAGGYAR
jgi:hypothetical protein